jgi:cytosine/adenosine deaminase-related metal-dependent hydrolase
MAFSLRARVVYPVDRAPIEHGVVTLEGERIVAVGTLRSAADELRDLGDVALLPGLINAHTHLEFSHLRRPLGTAGMRLADWIRLVIAERSRGDVRADESVAAGLAESAAAGVTSLGEIATGDAELYRVSQPLGVHRFAEVIGFSRARAASALTALMDRLDEPAEDPGSPGPLTGISPHAPYTVSPELMRALVSIAQERGLPMAMHLAESEDELTFLNAGCGAFQELLEERGMWDAGAVPRGSRPLDYLRMLGAAPRAVAIHGNFLSAEEQLFLAAHRDHMSLVYCPRTHAFFDLPPYPLSELLEAGVRVALGTDSRASNADLDLVGEMRFLARTHPAIHPETLLRLGTLAGAEALGCADDEGSLTPGKLANMMAVPLPPNCTGSPRELLESVLAEERTVYATWWRGQMRHRDTRG